MKPRDPPDEYMDALVAAGIATPILVQGDKVFIVNSVGTHEVFVLDEQEVAMHKAEHNERVTVLATANGWIEAEQNASGEWFPKPNGRFGDGETIPDGWRVIFKCGYCKRADAHFVHPSYAEGTSLICHECYKDQFPDIFGENPS